MHIKENPSPYDLPFIPGFDHYLFFHIEVHKSWRSEYFYDFLEELVKYTGAKSMIFKNLKESEGTINGNRIVMPELSRVFKENNFYEQFKSLENKYEGFCYLLKHVIIYDDSGRWGIFLDQMSEIIILGCETSLKEKVKQLISNSPELEELVIRSLNELLKFAHMTFKYVDDKNIIKDYEKTFFGIN